MSTPTAPSPLALSIATSLMDRWSIGVSSTFCDEVDWDSASVEEVALAIDAILLPRLAAQADAIEAALDSSVDSRAYPDGPNLERDIRAALRVALSDLKPS